MNTCNVHGMPTSLFFRTTKAQRDWFPVFKYTGPTAPSHSRLDDMDMFLEDNLHSHVPKVPQARNNDPFVLSHLISLLRPSKCWLNHFVWKRIKNPRVWSWCHLQTSAPNRSAPHTVPCFPPITAGDGLISNLASPPSPDPISRGESIGPISRNLLYGPFTYICVFYRAYKCYIK